jgi:Carboxypeptidase regulatory-like domain/TonB dependent receptor-like, beta-barrel
MACRNSLPARGFALSLLMCIAFTVAMSIGASAQSQAINGTIRGRVVDPSSAAVADAAVTVTNTGTGFTRTVNTSSDGYYVFPNLPLGRYTVSLQKAGFASVKHADVVLEAGKEAVIDMQLKLGQVETQIEVTGGAPLVEPARVNIGRTIDEVEVQNLPLTSRNPYNFILFQPGVSGHPNPELGIPRTINTNGLMDRINYQMDGMVDTQSDRYGLRLFPISDTYVREVQTVANSFAPEFGGTSGNIYNVITNSGTNTFHGMFNWIRRSVDATARPILLKPTAPKPELKLQDFGMNAGAPIVKDKLFFFAAYEHLTRGVPTSITIDPGDAARLGISNNLLGSAPGVLHGQFLNARIDWNVTARNQVFFRYNYFRNQFPINTNSNGLSAGLSALDAWSDFRDRAHIIGMQWVSTISPNLLNEFRFSWPYRQNAHSPGSQTGPGPVILVSGKAAFNGTNAAGDRFAEKIPNANENLTWIRGRHTFKFGFNVSDIIDLQRSLSFDQYTFPSVDAYLAAKSGANPFAYTTFSTQSDPTGLHYRSLFWGFYGQDTWQVTPNLLLIYGLRYDRYQPPDANVNAPFSFSRKFNTPSGNVAPRLGFSYRINEKTVLRASAGIFYDAPPTNLWFNTLNSGRIGSASISSTAPGAPAFPAIISLTAASAQDITTITPNYKNAHTVNASLQVSREFSRNDVVSLGYVFTGGRNLVFLHNINLINPIGTLADGRPIFSSTVSDATRMDPRFNNILVQDVGANSSYNALLVTWNHRLSRGLQVSASYTWSHTISDAPEVNAFEQNLPIEDPTNLKRDRANASVDRPHAFTVSAVLQPQPKLDNRILNKLLNDNMFAILANLSSGDPQNIVANRTLNGDTTTGSVTRPLFVARNTARTPNIYQVDLRYTRTLARFWERVTPQFLIEANNLFNHPNVTSINATATVDTSGAITAPPTFAPTGTVLEGRIVQFGLGVRW